MSTVDPRSLPIAGHILHLLTKAGSRGLTDRELKKAYIRDASDGNAPEVLWSVVTEMRSVLTRKGFVLTRRHRNGDPVWLDRNVLEAEVPA